MMSAGGRDLQRAFRALLALALVSFTLAATACTDAAGPRSSPVCDITNGNTCLNHDVTNGNT